MPKLTTNLTNSTDATTAETLSAGGRFHFSVDGTWGATTPGQIVYLEYRPEASAAWRVLDHKIETVGQNHILHIGIGDVRGRIKNAHASANLAVYVMAAE